MEANPASIIFISRKRLCKLASNETRKEWERVIDEIKPIDPELADVCVPECVYRGFCPEPKKVCCGYNRTGAFEKAREKYIDLHRKCNEKRKK